MVNKTFKIFLLCALCFTSACGTFYGIPDESAGSQLAGSEASLANFDAEAGRIVFKSFSFPGVGATGLTNTIKTIQFTNNVCNAFSFVSITDEKGFILTSDVARLNVLVPAGKVYSINIKFDPKPCDQSNYETTMGIFYTDASAKNIQEKVILRVAGSVAGDNSEVEDCGSELAIDPRDLRDVNDGNSPPSPGVYYLRVTKMTSFIYPDSLPDYAALVGTSIGNLVFVSPSLKITVKATNDPSKAEFELEKITSCKQFYLPTENSDRNFSGASVLLTSDKAITGTFTFNSRLRKTEVELKGFPINLRAEDIGESSIEDVNTNIFQASLNIDLITGALPSDLTLGQSLHTRPNYEDNVLNLTADPHLPNAYKLYGASYIDGNFTLVGKGIFNNDKNNFIGNDTARGALVEKPAYIYVQLDVQLKTLAP